MFRISKRSKDKEKEKEKEKEKDKKVDGKKSKKEKKARERAYYMMGDEDDQRHQPLLQQRDDDVESGSYGGDSNVDRERTHSGGSTAFSTSSLFGARKVYHVQREHSSYVRKEPHVTTTRSSVTGGSQTDLKMSPPPIAKRKSSLKFTPKINQQRSESSSSGKHPTSVQSTHSPTATSQEPTTKATLITQMHNIRLDSSSSHHHPLHPVEETIQAQFTSNNQASSKLNSDRSLSQSISFSLPPLKPLFPTDASRTITIPATPNASVDSLKIKPQMLTRLRSHSQSTIFFVDGINDILPGDRLLTIDGVPVEKKNLQDIRQMIANRNPSRPFQVTVVPIPDLYELYSRIDQKYLLQAPDQHQVSYLLIFLFDHHA